MFVHWIARTWPSKEFIGFEDCLDRFLVTYIVPGVDVDGLFKHLANGIRLIFYHSLVQQEIVLKYWQTGKLWESVTAGNDQALRKLLTSIFSFPDQNDNCESEIIILFVELSLTDIIPTNLDNFPFESPRFWIKEGYAPAIFSIASYLLLAVFWFNTSSSIASLIFTGEGVFAISSLSTIFLLLIRTSST